MSNEHELALRTASICAGTTVLAGTVLECTTTTSLGNASQAIPGSPAILQWFIPSTNQLPAGSLQYWAAVAPTFAVFSGLIILGTYMGYYLVKNIVTMPFALKLASARNSIMSLLKAA